MFSLDNLKKERNRLVKRLEIIDALIEEYSDPELDFKFYLKFKSKITDSLISGDTFKDDFPKNKTWLNQLLYLLDKHERFLGNTEMADLLLPYYPDKNIDGLKRRVSVVISDAFKNKKVRGLIKLKISTLPQGFVWGYTKWLDSKGGIRERYEPFRHNKSLTM